VNVSGPHTPPRLRAHVRPCVPGTGGVREGACQLS
jgi:hypothetical protein